MTLTDALHPIQASCRPKAPVQQRFDQASIRSRHQPGNCQASARSRTAAGSRARRNSHQCRIHYNTGKHPTRGCGPAQTSSALVLAIIIITAAAHGLWMMHYPLYRAANLNEDLNRLALLRIRCVAVHVIGNQHLDQVLGHYHRTINALNRPASIAATLALFALQAVHVSATTADG